MYRDSIAQLERARAELAEMGNPYAYPVRDWIDDHLRHLALQRYQALQEEVAAIERRLDREVA
ncbi:putative hypothetical protein [Allomeiothermus silvanus DSM 9946]|uniref:Uncharacterized protein n=1 Tax=Allomeiothermus silvanus (strain ATCC 700542 / DSM 9946 / NBRC 106475 / NCIMB 13440 / VI-R2) TaxID=526227 RepID=D7BDT3_ALLS1|nr:hypothetical protein [Allomeiothermus silvanus]ADH63084.1 putative hypothetical protein [Allomeiothermus silvanus DSM 9946]